MKLSDQHETEISNLVSEVVRRTLDAEESITTWRDVELTYAEAARVVAILDPKGLSLVDFMDDKWSEVVKASAIYPGEDELDDRLGYLGGQLQLAMLECAAFMLFDRIEREWNDTAWSDPMNCSDSAYEKWRADQEDAA